MLTLAKNVTSYTQHQQRFIAFLEQPSQQQLLAELAITPAAVIAEFAAAHQQVLVKLINALLREKIMQLQGNLLSVANQSPQPDNTWQLIGYSTLANGEINDLHKVINTKQQQVCCCVELLLSLSNLYREDKLTAFKQDLQQTWFNSALALAYKTTWREQLACKEQNFWQFLTQLDNAQAYIFLEQWAAVGHPSHPTDRSKPELTLAQIIAYSPDFNAQVALTLAALKSSHSSLDSMINGEEVTNQDIRLYWQEYFPEAMAKWRQQLTRLGLNEQDYLPIPVHPWQAEQVLPRLFAKELQQQILVILAQITITTRPSLSFRSMLPLSANAPCLKVPVAIKMTSALRLLSTRSAHMGPRFSKLMIQLLNKLPQVHQYLAIQGEVFGVHYHAAEAIDDFKASNLAYICRQNANTLIDAQEMIIPAASLVTPTVQNKPLWLSMLQQQGDESWSAAQTLLSQYCKVLCQGPLAFYLHTGIALEVHQQNTLLVCAQNGQIRRCITRDFGAFRVYFPQFKTTGLSVQFHHDNRLQTSDPEQARNRLVHAMFISQLGEFIKSLQQHYQQSIDLERQAWLIVKKEINYVAQILAGQVDNTWLAQEITAFLHAPWSMKALMRMRLQTGDEYIYTTLANPLSKD